MTNNSQPGWSRRQFLWASLTLPAATLLAACSEPTTESPVASGPTIPVVTPAQATAPSAPAAPVAPAATAAEAPATLPLTPACSDDDDLTPAQTEGPYYTPNSPERASLLEPGMEGTPMIVAGLVVAADCTPVAQALVDIWHCDNAGHYDNVGYRLRGHQFTDQQGRYRIETIMPGLYPGRTRHFHIKVQAPNSPILTTQLYFPGEPDNASDGIYQPELELTIQDIANGKEGNFTFVVERA